MARARWSLWLVVVMLAGCASSGGAPPAAEPAAEPAPPPVQAPTPAAAATEPIPVPAEVPKSSHAIVTAKARTDAARALDPGRHPGEVLAFFGVKAAMKVAEIFAGGAYTTELLARAV